MCYDYIFKAVQTDKMYKIDLINTSCGTKNSEVCPQILAYSLPRALQKMSVLTHCSLRSTSCPPTF